LEYDWEFNDVGTRPERQFAIFITLSIWHIKVLNTLQQMQKEKPYLYQVLWKLKQKITSVPSSMS
jgi:hypothetical protein